MKLTVFLVILSLFKVQANTYSQIPKITLQFNQVRVETVLEKIQKDADMNFLYNVNDIDLTRRISIDVKKKPLSKVLTEIFSPVGISFDIVEKQIILYPAPPLIHEVDSPSQKLFTVAGVVTNEDGMPLTGASVQVKGVKKGTITNFDGEYSLQIQNPKAILIFSYIGYQTKEVPVNGQENIDVVLTKKTGELDAVVLVGYGKTTRKDLTGSVSTIDVNEMNKLAPTNFEAALVGKAPGVYVVPSSGAPGAAATIRIRGITSIFGNNEPLYVIDGVPIEIGRGLGNSFYSESIYNSLSPLASINPQDIKSITILKDASSTAIYGSRGANGVVLVTTKKGSYSSVPSIGFSATTSISEFTNHYSMLNTEQFHSVIERAYANASTDLPGTNELYPYGKNVNTDWQEATDQNAVSTNYYLNVNGGSLKTSTLYSLSAGITDQKGAIYGTEFKRYNFRSKIETKLTDKLKVGANAIYSDARNKGSNTTFYYQTITYRPDIPIYDDKGNYAVATDSVQSNPYAKVRYPAYIENKNLILSLFGEYEITDGLLFKSMYSYNKNNSESFRYTPSYDIFEIRNNRKGTLKQTNSLFTSKIFDNTLTYSKTFDKHDINAVVGASFTQNESGFLSIDATDFPDDEIMVTPGAASSQSITSGGTISGLSSYFLRANYDFDDKYYLTFTGRADKSTKFAPDHRWGIFPSAALAWRISEEDFLNDISFIDDIKLRSSYGKVGSANFSDFQYATFFDSGSYYNNHNGLISNTIPNPNIKWETTRILDIGLDFSFFNRRLNGTIGYFNKVTSDQILLRDVILETGGTSQFANIGDFLNRGFEFHIGVDVFSGENFQWTTDINLTTIKSKVLELNGGYYRNLIEGQPPSYFSGYKVAGIFQNQEEINALNTASPSGVYQSGETAPGDFKYVDVNDDGFIGDDDITVIGKAAPDFYGGWNNIFRIGNFEISALFNFSVGNYLFNSNKKDLLIFNNYGSNYSTDILDAWTTNNRNTSIPRLIAGDPNNNSRDSDFFIEDASFFKLKNLFITYRVPQKFLEKFVIKRASISLSASNIFVITSYSGLDPEVNYSSASNFNQGYDSAAYPPVRTFTLGINLNL